MGKINLPKDNEKIKLNLEIDKIKKVIKRQKIIMFVALIFLVLFFAISFLINSLELYIIACVVSIGITFYRMFFYNRWLIFLKMLIKNPSNYKIIQMKLKNTLNEPSKCDLEISYYSEKTKKICTKDFNLNLEFEFQPNTRSIQDIAVRVDDYTVHIIAQDLSQAINNIASIVIDEKYFQKDIDTTKFVGKYALRKGRSEASRKQ